MNIIKINQWLEIPDYFTGIAEYLNGTKEWYKEGHLHREDGPAYEGFDGHKAWWINGKRHREDGPAIEYVSGEKQWYKNGKLHRLDGPAVEYSVEDFSWYVDGQCYVPVILSEFVVLDSYQGKYNIFWYKLLDKDKTIERPDIPGLIKKE